MNGNHVYHVNTHVAPDQTTFEVSNDIVFSQMFESVVTGVVISPPWVVDEILGLGAQLQKRALVLSGSLLKGGYRFLKYYTIKKCVRLCFVPCNAPSEGLSRINVPRHTHYSVRT